MTATRQLPPIVRRPRSAGCTEPNAMTKGEQQVPEQIIRRPRCPRCHSTETIERYCTVGNRRYYRCSQCRDLAAGRRGTFVVKLI